MKEFTIRIDGENQCPNFLKDQEKDPVHPNDMRPKYLEALKDHGITFEGDPPEELLDLLNCWFNWGCNVTARAMAQSTLSSVFGGFADQPQLKN